MGRAAKPKTALGQRIIDVRGERLRVEFAGFLGTSQHALASYERGQTTPNMEFLEALVNVEGIDLNWLLTGKGEMYLPDEPPTQPLDANLMEIVVEAVEDFQGKNRRFRFEPEKRWIIYMICYRKLIEIRDKYRGPEARTQFKEELFDLLRLSIL